MALTDYSDDDIDLEQPKAGGLPSVKFNQPGDVLVAMICHVNDDEPRGVYNRPGEFHRKPNGEIQTKTVQTLLVMPGTKGVTVKQWNDETGEPMRDAQGRDMHREVQPGEFVRRHIEGGKRWDYFQAKRQTNPQRVGDVMRERYTEDTFRGRNGEQLQQAKHIHTYELRRRKPEEAALFQQAKAKYYEVVATPDIPLEQPKTWGETARPTPPTFEEEPF